ncbi:hypothetical protein [Dactylosporangium sp. NPDC048998]|uniref:hypothetical protein n=1 Tax=Dactylosporangium sp. NPDC048998 TaxID=3363976 RepID=UPI00372214F5
MAGGIPRKLIDAIWVGIVVVVMLCVAAYCSSRDSGDAVAVDQADAQSVAAGLARASAAHGICYGWQLLDSTTPVSSGSNLGVGVRVTDSPEQCPKYVEVRGAYHNYPDGSESEDYAQYTIVSSAGNAARIDAAGLERLGAGTNRLLDDPAAAILDAAEALPLLALEAGVAEGAVPQPSATGTPLPVAEGGSDFLRDRWVLLVISGSLLLAAAGTVVLGLVVARNLDDPEKPAKPKAKPKKKPGSGVDRRGNSTGRRGESDPNSRVDRPFRGRRRSGRGD